MFCKAPFGFAVPASPTNETRGEGTGFACESHQQTKPEGAEGPFIISHGECQAETGQTKYGMLPYWYIKEN